MTEQLSFSKTLPGDTVRIGEAECLVVERDPRQRRLTLRRTTGSHYDRRFVHATAHQYDAARAVLVRGKGKP